MRKTTGLLVFCLLFPMFVYGATKFPLKGTALTPAARGEVEVSTDKKNGNSNVKIKVEHLAPPENLTPAMIGYLVWFTEKGGKPVSQGRMRIDKNLKASFETTTPFKNFDVSITAERDASVTTPTGQEALKGTVQR